MRGLARLGIVHGGFVAEDRGDARQGSEGSKVRPKKKNRPRAG
jgi:hypothetical protein